MNKSKIITKTAKHVRSIMEGEGSGHDWWHVYLVWKMAKKIAKKEGGDLFVIELGALLHDISDWKFSGDEHSGEIAARKWLETLHVEKEVIDQVCYIVGNISYKGAKVKHELKTLEAEIIYDADKLDIGAIGIARTFAYGGFTKRPIYVPGLKPRMHTSFEDYKNNSNNGSINHFYEKLLLIKDRMHTKTSRKIAVEREKFLKKFLKQFFAEWEGKA